MAGGLGLMGFGFMIVN